MHEDDNNVMIIQHAWQYLRDIQTKCWFLNVHQWCQSFCNCFSICIVTKSILFMTIRHSNNVWHETFVTTIPHLDWSHYKKCYLTYHQKFCVYKVWDRNFRLRPFWTHNFKTKTSLQLITDTDQNRCNIHNWLYSM